MDLRYSLALRITPKIYLLVQLSSLLLFSFTYIEPVQVLSNLVIALVGASLVDLVLNGALKRLVHLPDAAVITAYITVGVLATNTPISLLLLLLFVALVAKHFIRYKGRHIFNPGNLAILLGVFLFGQSTEWWLASNLIIIGAFGLYIMYKLKHIWHPLSFIAAYFILFFATSPSLSVDFIQNQLFADFSIYFFAFVMLPEPQTAPWNTKGRVVSGILTALLAISATLLGLKAPLIIALFVANITSPIINKFTYSKKR